MVCCWAGYAQQHNQQQLEKLSQAFHYLNNNYIDNIDLEPLVAEAIDSALKELDPHSEYLTRDEFMAMNEGIKGEFSGIGSNFITLRDTVIITRTLKSSPSERAGLKKNDRILSVNGTSLIGIERNEVVELLRGTKGSTATLSILRNGEVITTDVIRDDIPTSAIGASYMHDGGIAYVRVESFLSKTTTEEFRTAIKELKERPNAIILDLRGNIGGLLPSAVRFAELFLNRGDVIVTVEGRKNRTTYEASQDGKYADIPIVVLIDEHTASASEIVAGALQDHDRATIVGRRSYGKGLVQRLVKFKDESGMKITIARYKTPSGRIIQRPYTNGERERYIADTERYHRRDTTSIPDSLIYTTLNLKRKVYGGGGISPDIYIDADTTALHPFTKVALEHNIIEQVIVNIFDNMPIEEFLSHHPTPEEYGQSFTLDARSITLIKALVEEIEPEAVNDREGLNETMAIIKAQVAEEAFGGDLYYKMYGCTRDEVHIRALDIIEHKLFQKSTLSHIGRKQT